MAVNYKIGADASQFNKSVNEAQANLKTLDAALKVNENSFKVAGDAQIYMSQKTQMLTDKMNRQKQLVTQLQQGLKQMREAGVAPTSVEYQKLEKDMLNAQNAMLETKQAIDSLDGSQQKGAKSAGELTTAVNSIGKKISLDQVISGINSITGAMETAAGKAVKLGETIWTNVMDSARWADDTATMALMYGISVDELLRVQKLVTNGADFTVESVLNSQAKLNKNIGSGNKQALETLNDLHIVLSTVTGEDMDIIQRKDPAEVFFEIGNALMAMGEGYDKEAAAQSLFGKSWRELVPLFDSYKSVDEWKEALAGVTVESEEDVSKLAELNDEVGKLKGNFETLSNEVWAQMAPALTNASKALSGVLENVMEDLKTPEGQQALQDMQTAVSGLFEDLGKIEPEQVVSGFTKVFNTVVGSLQWLVDHKDGVIRALKDIVVGWAGLRLTGGALEVMRLINGLRGLNGGDGSSGSGGSTTARPTGTGTFFGDTMKTGTGTAAAKIADMMTSFRGVAFISTLLGIPMLDKIANTNWLETFPQMWHDVSNVSAVKSVAATSPEQNRRAFRALLGFGSENGQDLLTTALEVIGISDGGGGGGSHGFGQWKKKWGEDVISGAVSEWAEEHSASKSRIPGIENLNAEWEAFTHEFLKSTVENVSEVLRDFSEKQPITATPAGQTMTLLDLFWPKKNRLSGEEGVPVTVEPVAEDNAAEDISKQVGPVEIPAILMVTSDHVNPWTSLGSFSPGGPAVFYYSKDLNEHANGIWSVPFDGYPALLHKNERIVPEREVSSQNFNSNLYVEKMYMNNGADAQGLADVIAARQRRQSRGYGS